MSKNNYLLKYHSSQVLEQIVTSSHAVALVLYTLEEANKPLTCVFWQDRGCQFLCCKHQSKQYFLSILGEGTLGFANAQII